MNTVTPVSTTTVHPALVGSETEAMTTDLGVASQVMAIRGACRAVRAEGQQAELRSSDTQRQAHIDARLDAMRRAEEARGDGGFWDNVGDVLKVVGAVAAIVVGLAGSVFTGGASGVAAGVLFALLTASTVAAPYAGDWLASATNMSDEARLALNGSIAALCIVAAVFNPGAAATSTANVATASARLTSTAAQALIVTQRMAQSTAIVSGFVSGYGTAMQGRAAIEEGEAQAQATREEGAMRAATYGRGQAMDELKNIAQEAQRVTRQVMRTLETEEMSQQAAIRA